MSKKKQTKQHIQSTLIECLCMSALKLSMEAVYIFGTIIQYAYLGRYLAFNLDKYIAGWVVFLLTIIAIQAIRNEQARFFISVLFMLSGTANISLFGMKNYPVSFFLMAEAFWLLLILSTSVITRKREIIVDAGAIEKNRQLQYRHRRNIDIVFFLSLLISMYLIAKYGVNNIGLLDVYSVRSAFRQRSIPQVDTYLISWNATVFLPWCFLHYVEQKKNVFALFCLVFAYLMFSINGMKTWLFFYIAIFGIFILSKWIQFSGISRIIALGISVLQVISASLALLRGNYTFTGIMDRTMILPGEINYYYIEWFSSREHLFLRESIMKTFSPSPYNPISSIQISQFFMRNAFYHNATNGMLGDAYANFGLLGVIVYPVMISICIYLLLKFYKIDGIGVSAGVYFVQAWILTNTSFFTWLMTGGFLAYMAIEYVHRRFMFCFGFGQNQKKPTKTDDTSYEEKLMLD